MASSRGLEPPGLFLALAGGSGEKGLSQGGDQEPDGYSIRAPPPVEKGEPLYGTVEMEAACLAPQGLSDHEKGNGLVC